MKTTNSVTPQKPDPGLDLGHLPLSLMYSPHGMAADGGETTVQHRPELSG